MSELILSLKLCSFIRACIKLFLYCLKFLKNCSERVIAIAPSIELKDQWIEKLKNRYEASKLDKDYRAYMNAVDRYTENIKEIAKDCDTVFIRSMTYDIASLIEAHLSMAESSATIFDGI